MRNHHPKRFARGGMACLLALAMISLSACGDIKPAQKDARERTLDDFASTMRWGDFNAAFNNFVDPDTKAEHALSDLDKERFKQLEVAGYEVTANSVGDGIVDREIRLDLINRNTQIPRSVVYKEHWRWDAATKHWWLVSGLPDLSPQD